MKNEVLIDGVTVAAVFLDRVEGPVGILNEGALGLGPIREGRTHAQSHGGQPVILPFCQPLLQLGQTGLSPDNSGKIALNSFETRKKEKTWMEWAADCYEFVRCYKMKCKIRLLLLKFNHFIPEKGVTEHRRVRNAGTYRF